MLPCFHTFCQPCLERCQEHPEKITCPTCHTDCQLGVGGVAGLLPDYGVCGVQVTTLAKIFCTQFATRPSQCQDTGLEGAYCTGCKSRESSAVARCFDCSNFLCANCVMAHQVNREIFLHNLKYFSSLCFDLQRQGL